MCLNFYEKCEEVFIKKTLCSGSLDMPFPDSKPVSLYYTLKRELNESLWNEKYYYSRLYHSSAGRIDTPLFSEKDLPKPVKCEYGTAAQVLIVTSIAPKGIEKQRTAIDSWCVQGFSVASVNYPDEILILKEHFPDVEFISTTMDSFPTLGKKRVYINDLLKALSEFSGTYSVMGIVNSDVALYQLDADKLTGIGNRELIISNRIDVPSDEVYFFGVDAFFFSPALLDEDNGELSQYLLGEPWWDVAFPWFCMKRGFEISRACPPLCTHIEHEIAWSSESWWDLARVFYRSVVKELELYWNVSKSPKNLQVNTTWFFLFVMLMYIEAESIDLLHGKCTRITTNSDLLPALSLAERLGYFFTRPKARPKTLSQVFNEVDSSAFFLPHPSKSTFNPAMLYYVDTGGWYQGEEWGTWASTQKSFFSFHTPPAKYLLQLNVIFFKENSRSDALHISVNGCVVYTGAAVASTVSLDITPELFVDNVLRVELVTDEPLQSPESFGMGGDSRPLAVGISTITLKKDNT